MIVCFTRYPYSFERKFLFYGKILATKYLACDLEGAIFKLLFQRNSKPCIKTSASINETFDLGLPHYTFKHVQTTSTVAADKSCVNAGIRI